MDITARYRDTFMAVRANKVLHVVNLSSGNEVDNLRDLPRSVCSDAALDRVRAVLAGDGLDPETGVSIHVTEAAAGRAEFRAQSGRMTDPVHAWVCWEAATADRYWTEIALGRGAGDGDPMQWLSENVSVPWLAIRSDGAGGPETPAPPAGSREQMRRILEATAWVLIEAGSPASMEDTGPTG